MLNSQNKKKELMGCSFRVGPCRFFFSLSIRKIHKIFHVGPREKTLLFLSSFT